MPAYLIVIPLILIIAPQMGRLVGFLFAEKPLFENAKNLSPLWKIINYENTEVPNGFLKRKNF
jgi:hypothetical protein